MARETHSTLSNPAYTALLVQLAQAKAHLEAAESIRHELCRDGMLVGEGRNIKTAIGEVAYMELLVRVRAAQ